MNNKELRVRNSPEFKLKDKAGRQYTIVNLKDFGFLPERIIIEKTYGRSNTFIIRAILTDEEIKKEDEHIKNLKAKNEKNKSSTKKDSA